MLLQKIRNAIAKYSFMLDNGVHKRQNKGELWQKTHITHARQQAGSNTCLRTFPVFC